MKKILYTFSALLFISTTTSAQWVNTNYPGQGASVDMAVVDNKLFVASIHISNGGLYTTLDGDTWNILTDVGSGANTVKVFDDVLYVGKAFGNQLYTSSDVGQNWTNIPTMNPSSGVVNSIYKNGSILIYGDDGLYPSPPQGTYFSVDNGNTWTASTYPPSSNKTTTRDIVELNGKLYCPRSAQTILKSDDNGANWEEVTTSPNTVSTLCTINGGLLAGGSSIGVHRSVDGGTTWTQVLGGPVGDPKNHIYRVHYENGIAFACGGQGLIYQSDDNGLTWTDISISGLPLEEYVQSIKIFNGELYAGTFYSVYKRDFGSSTGLVPTAKETFSFAVYPNPANDFVTITNIPNGSTVKVTDITGKVVYSSVAKGEQTVISTSNFVNGVYIIQVENNGAVAHRKLVVSK